MKNGFFFIDKPKDWTTFDIIRDLRKKTGERKIGHTGTLDPFATGLVILCMNKTTRLSNFILSSEKEYVTEIELGIQTDTADTEGKVINRQEVPQLSEQLITEAAQKMLTLQTQIPPRFSAIKIDGKPAYHYARKGKDIEMKAREIVVQSFTILSHSDNRIIYRTRVSKGTYIRSLSETLAEFLGTIAYTRELRRLRINEFTVSDAVSPDQITSSNWEDYLKPIHRVFSSFPSIHLNDKGVKSFVNGNRVLVAASVSDSIFEYETNPIDFETVLPDESIMVYNKVNEALGLGSIEKGYLHPKVVFV